MGWARRGYADELLPLEFQVTRAFWNQGQVSGKGWKKGVGDFGGGVYMVKEKKGERRGVCRSDEFFWSWKNVFFI